RADRVGRFRKEIAESFAELHGERPQGATPLEGSLATAMQLGRQHQQPCPSIWPLESSPVGLLQVCELRGDLLGRQLAIEQRGDARGDRRLREAALDGRE